MKMNLKKATVKIRFNENCFLNINGTSHGGHYEVEKKDGKAIQTWVGDEVWVTPEYAEKAIQGSRPIARIIQTKEIIEPPVTTAKTTKK